MLDAAFLKQLAGSQKAIVNSSSMEVLTMIHRLLLVLLVLLFTAVDAASAKQLTVWHTETDPATISAMDTIARRFEAENPGVKVQIISVGWADLYRKITVAIQSGEVPDVTQIEPFMAAYLHRAGQLQPMDEIVNGIGKEDIFPAVRDLQSYEGRYYGIATALGISYYSFRRDFLPSEAASRVPKTWDEYLKFIQQPQANGSKAVPLLLPANDLHMTLLFTELLASNGGSLFDRQGHADFGNPRVLETIKFWNELFKLIPSNLQSSSYTDNFGHYAQGRSLTLPGFFGRGTLQIERSAPESVRSPEHFALFPHLIGPNGTKAYATLDAEPWVILRRAPDPELGKKFLLFFYRKDNYLQFCSSVPIHLTPILQSLARGADYAGLSMVQKWRPYYDYQLSVLDSGAVLPIFMARPEDRNIPELFTLEGTGVVSNMLRDVTLHGKTPEEATQSAMKKAALLSQSLPTASSETARSTLGWNKYVGLVAGAILLALALVAVVRMRKRRQAS
jgi:multiple sugar transport system substrate-binding protein